MLTLSWRLAPTKARNRTTDTAKVFISDLAVEVETEIEIAIEAWNLNGLTVLVACIYNRKCQWNLPSSNWT